jgi:hypothetical protein
VQIPHRRGRLIDTVDLAERPIQPLFGGADRRTLFEVVRNSPYAVWTQTPGRCAGRVFPLLVRE